MLRGTGSSAAGDRIEQRIARMVTPSRRAREEKERIADMVMERVKCECSPFPEIVGAELGGSYAKGTWLADRADIDVFVKFRESTPESRFRTLGEKIGLGALVGFKPYMRYSEHPFVEATVMGTTVNVVPCYDVREGEWKSAADRSQFHTRFMCAALDEKKRCEVRMLKRFLKANGIYGAEIARQGFGGYVTEVLVWNLGGFRRVLERFSGIAESEVIGDASKEFDTVVTIVDPIDGNRNLAAAISGQNIARFILASRAYLKNPSMRFFREAGAIKAAPVAARQVMEQVVAVEFGYEHRSPDIVWGQIKRASSSLSAQLETEGFVVLRNSAVSDELGRAALVFLLESIKVPGRQAREGPEVFKEEASANFVAKNRRRSRLMWVNGVGRIVSLEDRRFTDAGAFLQHLLTSRLARSGIPKGLRADIKGGFKISVAGRGLRKSIKEGILEFVTTDEKTFSSR